MQRSVSLSTNIAVQNAVSGLEARLKNNYSGFCKISDGGTFVHAVMHYHVIPKVGIEPKHPRSSW